MAAKKKKKFHFVIVLIMSLFILIVSFCAYMNNTTLEEVLDSKYDNGIVVHQYDYDSSSST